MTQKFVNMTTFSRDGSEMVNMAYGKLTLRTADATGTVISDNLFATTISTESMSHPFWSPDGSAMAFVSWAPGKYGAVAGQQVTGDMVQGAQIWIAPSDGKNFTGPPTLLVPRSPLDAAGNATYSSYYPSISDDGTWVVFDRSSCSGPADPIATDWGAGACDGYNDYSAQLMLIAAAGGTPVLLANANGTQTWTNSWPRWSPDHGKFRGNTLYWIAFSSRRDYGLSLKGSTNGSTKPQMWFTAVVVDKTNPGKDPSFAPVWLPGQDPDPTGPRGNHTPAWTSVALPIP
jgi:Tol biopolymer transport system component